MVEVSSVEQEPAQRIGPVVDRAPDVELHLLARQLVDDIAGIGDRTGEAVELGHDEHVARPTRRHRLSESRPIAVDTREPMVDVDPISLPPRATRALRCAVRSCPSVETRA
jgi:hypothetical protein